MPAEFDPTRSLQDAFEALARRDWQSLVDYVDPGALNTLRQWSLGLTILMAEQVQAGEDPSGGYNPQDVIIADHLAKVGSLRGPGFPGSPTGVELSALSSRNFFIRWCEAVYGSEAQADSMREVAGLYRRIIGSVTENDDLAQVLYRREVRGVDMGEPYASLPRRLAVMPLKLTDGQWRLWFNDDLGWMVHFWPFPHRKGPRPVPHHSLPPRIIPPTPATVSTERLNARPDPAAVVRGSFAAFDRADWASLAGMVEEEQLRELQNQQVAYLAAWPAMRDASAKDEASGVKLSIFWFEDPLPAEVISRVADLRIPGFPASLPVGKLAALLPRDFFAEWCKVAYSQKGTGLKTDVQRRILGQVFESDSLAHVLYRADRWFVVKVMSVKWAHGSWKVLFNEDIGWVGDLNWALRSE